MLSSTHFIAGAAIGRATGNPILAVVFGIIFHFLMDMVPHFDYGYFFKKTVRSFVIAVSDPFIGLIVFCAIAYFRHYTLNEFLIALIGGIACVLPDVMSVFIKLFKINKLKWMMVYHRKVHWFIKEKYEPFEWKEGYISKKGIFWGIIYQIPFIVISVYILLR